MEIRKKEKYKIPECTVMAKSFKTPSSKHQIFVKDLLYRYTLGGFLTSSGAESDIIFLHGDPDFLEI